MRKITPICILLALSFALIPFSLSYKNEYFKENPRDSDTAESQTVFLKKNESDKILAEAMKYADTSYSEETLKALLILVRNNLKISPDDNNTNTNTDNVDLYQALEKLLKKSKTELFYNDKKVYIPIAELSPGYIKPSDEYTYLKPVASPWDCLCTDFVYGKEYTAGISLYGIDFLCKEGLSAEKALAYYLVDFQIK